MIRATVGSDSVEFNVIARGLKIYLDNWAIINLAARDSDRRMRFIDAFHKGYADLLFSSLFCSCSSSSAL
jgi:hypothetical protein